jgi:hypothetical protein
MAVTVRAPDLAFAYLGVDRRQAATVPRKPRDGRSFAANVIELEDNRVT